MRYLLMGYFIFWLSLVVSLALSALAHLVVGWVFFPGSEFLLLPFGSPMVWYTGINAAVLAVQISGVIMCLVGYRRKEVVSRRRLLMILSLPPIVWGIPVVYFANSMYNYTLWRADFVEGTLETWDHLFYATWALKGVLWIAGSILLLAISRKLRAKQE